MTSESKSGRVRNAALAQKQQKHAGQLFCVMGWLVGGGGDFSRVSKACFVFSFLRSSSYINICDNATQIKEQSPDIYSLQIDYHRDGCIGV